MFRLNSATFCSKNRGDALDNDQVCWCHQIQKKKKKGIQQK